MAKYLILLYNYVLAEFASSVGGPMVLMPTRHGDVRVYVRWREEGKDFSSLEELLDWYEGHRNLNFEIHYWCLDQSGVIESVSYASGVCGTDTGQRVYLTTAGLRKPVTSLLEAVRERREALEQHAIRQQQPPKPLSGCKHKLPHRNRPKRGKPLRNKRRSAV